MKRASLGFHLKTKQKLRPPRAQGKQNQLQNMKDLLGQVLALWNDGLRYRRDVLAGAETPPPPKHKHFYMEDT